MRFVTSFAVAALAIPLSKTNTKIDEFVSPLCGPDHGYGATQLSGLPNHPSCDEDGIPTGWIVCPSRTRPGVCSFYCPEHGVTIQWRPENQCLSGGVAHSKAGYLPALAVRPALQGSDQRSIFVNPDAQELEVLAKQEFVKKNGGLNAHYLTVGKSEILKFLAAAFGLQEKHKVAVSGFIQQIGQPNYRYGGISFKGGEDLPGRAEDKSTIHIDLDYVSGRPVFGNENYEVDGVWNQWVEINVWFAMANPTSHPFLILDVDESDEKVCYKGKKYLWQGDHNQCRIIFTSADVAPWQPVCFGASYSFHGTFASLHGGGDRVSVDMRFQLPYNLLLQIATLSTTPQHLKNFFAYAKTPIWYSQGGINECDD